MPAASPPLAVAPVARSGSAWHDVGGERADSRALARLVAARRRELGLTQLELAQRMGAAPSLVASVECGRHQPTLETLQRLFGALGSRLVVGYELGPIEAPTAGERWQEGDMRRRWTAAGMLVAEQQFRRIIGYRDLAKLVIAIEHHTILAAQPNPDRVEVAEAVTV